MRLSTVVTALCLAVGVYGHGRLQVPKTRKHVAAGSDVYENSPVSGSAGADFACRNDPGATVPAVNTFTAGQTMTVRWSLSADHVGDCALYVSYDWNKSGADKANMKFFKIANWRSCKNLEDQDLTVNLPEWLPEGRAVFRWDWYALHVFPTIEFYTQCADSFINGSPKSFASPQQVPSYSVVGLYALNGADGKFRNPWASPAPTFFTGPSCACRDSPLNGCPLSTDVSSPGYIEVPTLANCDGGAPVDPTPRPTPSPTAEGLTPSPTVETITTRTPTVVSIPVTPNPTSAPNGDCPAECSTCQTYNDAVCTNWCSEWNYCGITGDHQKGVDCRGCGNNGPSPTSPPSNPPNAVPTPAPTELSIPETPTPTTSLCATTAGALKGKANKYNKFEGDACACDISCAADMEKGKKIAYQFSAKKRQCFCYYKVKSKKGNFKVKNKGDFVHAAIDFDL